MSRARQRENTRIKNREIRAGLRSKAREEQIDPFNFYGIHDPTPYKAVKNMIRRGGESADDFHDAVKAARATA